MSNEITKVKDNSLDIFNPESFQAMYNVADMFSKTGLVPSSLRGKPADVLLILQMGNEMQMKPTQALQMIDCIQGKPTVKPQGMLALIRMKFPDAIIRIDDSINGKVVVTMGRCQSDQDLYTSTWTIDRAKVMGLTGKDNWKKQPQTMLKWRAVADAARTVFPDILLGAMIKDEAEDVKTPLVQQAEEMIAAKKDDIEMNEKILKKEKPEEDIGEFVISMGSLEGKKLKEIDVAELIEFYNSAKGHFEDGKVSMNNKEKVLLNVLEMYLTEKNLIEPK